MQPKRRAGELDKLELFLLGFTVALLIFLSGAIGIQKELGTVQSVFLDEGWSICAVQFSSREGDCTDPAVLDTAARQLGDVKLEQKLWEDNRKKYLYGSPAELCVDLVRADGEKKLLLFWGHNVVVYDEDENGKETGKPTTYLASGKLPTIEN